MTASLQSMKRSSKSLTEFVIQGVQGQPEEKIKELMLIHINAIDAFRSGQAKDIHGQTLCEMVNLVHYFALSLVGDHGVNEIHKAAESAVKAAIERFKKTNFWTLTNEEIKPVLDCLDVFEELLKIVPVKQQEKHIVKYESDLLKKRLTK